MIKKTKETPGELIYGLHPVIELLKAKRRKLISIYTTKPTPKGWQEIEKLMPKYPVAIQYVTRDVLHRMADTTDHQGIVAWVHSFPFRTKMFHPDKEQFLLMLDGLQDARNLGAILRTAYCIGVQGIIITQKSSVPLNGTAVKSAAGLSEYLEIYQAPSAQAAAQELQKAGYNLYLAAFGGQDATQCVYKNPLCIVIGGEGFGISKQVYQYGTQVTLPQRTPDISYNASVAAGILLFLVGKKNNVL
jgi:23S rRNA (guanosine2251-2'-O)-methyltransferase